MTVSSFFGLLILMYYLKHNYHQTLPLTTGKNLPRIFLFFQKVIHAITEGSEMQLQKRMQTERLRKTTLEISAF